MLKLRPFRPDVWLFLVLSASAPQLFLFCSHFHQVKDDLAAGKRSPIVRLGTATGAKVLTAATASLYVLTIVLIIADVLPLTGLVIFGSLPFAYQLVRHVEQNHAVANKVSNSKFVAINLYLSSSLLLILGSILSPYV